MLLLIIANICFFIKIDLGAEQISFNLVGGVYQMRIPKILLQVTNLLVYFVLKCNSNYFVSESCIHLSRNCNKCKCTNPNRAATLLT